MVESETILQTSKLEQEIFQRLNDFRGLPDNGLVFIPELYKEVSQISYNVGKKNGNRFRINAHFPYAEYAILYHDIIIAETNQSDSVYEAITKNNQMSEKIKSPSINHIGISVRPMKNKKVCFAIILMEFNNKLLSDALAQEIEIQDKRRYTVDSLLDHINSIREKLLLLPYRLYQEFMNYVANAKSAEELDEFAKKHDGRYLIIKLKEGGTTNTILKKLLPIVSFTQFIISVQASLGIKFSHQKGFLVITLFSGFTNDQSKIVRPDCTEITYTGEFHPYEKEKEKEPPLKRSPKVNQQSPLKNETPKKEIPKNIETPKSNFVSPETPTRDNNRTTTTPKKAETPRASNSPARNKWVAYTPNKSDNQIKTPSPYKNSFDDEPIKKCVASLTPKSPRSVSPKDLESLVLKWVNECRLTQLKPGDFRGSLTPFEVTIAAGSASEMRFRFMSSDEYQPIVAEPGTVAFISSRLEGGSFVVQIGVGFESGSDQVTYELRELLKGRKLVLMDAIEKFARNGVIMMAQKGILVPMDEKQREVLSTLSGFADADSILLKLENEVHLTQTVDLILREKYEETLRRFNYFNVYVDVGESTSVVGIFLVKINKLD